MTSVLMILTAARVWTLNDGTEHPTGFWAEEFVVPYTCFTDAGWDVTVATPGGTVPVVDELSLGISGGMPRTTKKLRARLGALAPVLEKPVDLYGVDAAGFDLVFYPGGHGPMEDLAHDEASGKLLSERLASGRPLALLCHAPAAITATIDHSGRSPFAGRKMTGLSNREELLNSFARKAPWLLEDKLKELGVDYGKGLIPLRPHVVVDRSLYTGQNPQSSRKLAEQLIADLGDHPRSPIKPPLEEGAAMSTLPDPIAPFLEPEAAQLSKDTDPHPRIYEVPPEEGRRILADLQGGEGVDRPDVDEEWASVDAGHWGSVRTRIIRPKGATGTLPVLFYIHGAGWVFGDEDTHDRLFRELVVGANAVGVFPVYDRAPEAKYPTQVEQNYAVGQWVLEHVAEHDGMDTSRIAVAGESVGGCMSAVFALMNSERGGIDLKAQCLLYPVTNADFDTPSYRQFAEGYYLTRDGMKWFWDQYTSDPAQRSEKFASPLQASLEDLGKMPKTLVIIDEADVLRDEGEQYANKLREAGVDVTSVRVAGMVHDFLLLDSLRDTKAANAARKLAVEFLRDALAE